MLVFDVVADKPTETNPNVEILKTFSDLTSLEHQICGKDQDGTTNCIEASILFEMLHACETDKANIDPKVQEEMAAFKKRLLDLVHSKQQASTEDTTQA